MDYYEWNFILARQYFNIGMAGREVRLYADESFINEIGKLYNVGFTDFITAVEKGPVNTTYSGICMKAYQIYKNWRKTRKYPPYIAYLVLFVLAAGTEGDWSSIAYYPRLNKLLGQPDKVVMPASFPKMQELWFDLEKWSKEDRLEQLGRFSAKFPQSWIHVGLPQSQTLLSIKERKSLAQVFYDNNFDPAYPPGENTIIKALINSSIIIPKTKALLKDNNEEKVHLKEALADLVIEELKQWDGSIPNGEDNHKGNHIRGIAKICLRYDGFAKIFVTRIRVKISNHFPEEDIILKDLNTEVEWICAEAKENWSKELRSQHDQKYLDARELDWFTGYTLIEEETGWKVKLVPARIKVFAPGGAQGFSQWIEASKINVGSPYYISCLNELRQNIIKWGMDSCDGFIEVSSDGLPEGWSIFKVDDIKTSHSEFEILQLSNSYTFELVGGIKTGRGNTYFCFAPPRVFMEGMDGSPKVKERELKKADGDFWYLPVNLPLRERIPIEAEVHGKVVRQYFELVNSFYQAIYNSPYRDRFGLLGNALDENGKNIISGAVVNPQWGITAPDYPFEIPSYLSHRIIFLGLLPGQIADWPNKDIPKDWNPVWAIAKLKRDIWKAYFIGENFNNKFGKKTKLHSWKKWRWVFIGLKVLPPDVETHRRLWEIHRKEAGSL